MGAFSGGFCTPRRDDARRQFVVGASTLECQRDWVYKRFMEQGGEMGDDTLRTGTTWVAVDPLTPDETWYREDALPPLLREWLERERANAPKLRVTHVDYENKTITMESE